ncbi:TnsD family Tn7-like transposition protein [Bradyrhizobium lablabi]|uniref:TnsD family Tn7-like transposition protein n=1 Tax=Bradyrhizobium lablabi TaxID=722472 RepID=UPI001BA63309|nr:TnsD family Tn7-like transposition protein [Bradyrhizobium lablabi]MBR0695330.1 TniQ family protein [Bradyrhizobium lablabi]
MAAQLPSPYPDELLYSVVARYLAYFSPKSTSDAIRAIIGKRWCSVGFGSELDLIASQTSNSWGMKSHEIVERHSLLPFYGAFFEPSVYLESVRRMCAAGENVLATGRGNLRHSVELRYCPRCASEDVANLGETYWRRHHQLPGVVVCTIHDQILLRSLPAQAAGGHYYDATILFSKGGVECASLARGERQLAREIAARCGAVLDGTCSKWTRLEVGVTYAQIARQYGFNFGSEKTDTDLLISCFVEFFGRDFLRKIGFRTGRSLFRSDSPRDPLSNVLVQTFVENYLEVRGFSGLLPEKSLYGWKCPNKYAKHPDGFRLTNVVRRVSRLGYDYFHARCRCGLNFAFHKAKDDDPLMPDRIVVSRWSSFQQKRAQDLFAKHLNVRAVASAMKVSHRTASKLISCEKSKLEKSVDDIAKLRKEWGRDRSRSTYQALLKHDRAWLLEQKGHQRVVGRLPVPAHSDSDLASSIRVAFVKIRNRGDNPTLTRLSEELGFRLIRSHLDDYPLSKAEVSAVIPTPAWVSARRRRGWTKKRQNPGSTSVKVKILNNI